MLIANPIPDGITEHNLDFIDKLACGGYSYTMRYKDAILAVGGVYYQWKGCYFAWATLDKLAQGHALPLTRATKHIIKRCAESLGANKVYTLISEDKISNMKWAKLLRFSYEYCMTSAGPNEENIIGMVFSLKRR
jgi:hypothetical protein